MCIKCLKSFVCLTATQYPHVLPHPVMNPVPPGLVASGAMVAGEMLPPLISDVASTTAISLGEKPGPEP